MKLNRSLEGKRVRIIDTDNEAFEGYVFNYVYPEDNDPVEIAEIDIEDCPQRPGQLIGFTENEIQSIEVIS